MIESGIYYNDWTVEAGRKNIYCINIDGRREKRVMTDGGIEAAKKAEETTFRGDLNRHRALMEIWNYMTYESMDELWG